MMPPSWDGLMPCTRTNMPFFRCHDAQNDWTLATMALRLSLILCLCTQLTTSTPSFFSSFLLSLHPSRSMKINDRERCKKGQKSWRKHEQEWRLVSFIVDFYTSSRGQCRRQEKSDLGCSSCKCMFILRVPSVMRASFFFAVCYGYYCCCFLLLREIDTG
jgi:hypothetical protein